MEGWIKLSVWRHWTSKQRSLQNTSFSFPGNNDPLNWGTASQGSGNTVPYGKFPITPGDKDLML